MAGGALCPDAVSLCPHPREPFGSLRAPPRHPLFPFRIGTRLPPPRLGPHPAVVFPRTHCLRHHRREFLGRGRLYRRCQPAGAARREFRPHRSRLRDRLHLRARARRLAGGLRAAGALRRRRHPDPRQRALRTLHPPGIPQAGESPFLQPQSLQSHRCPS